MNIIYVIYYYFLILFFINSWHLCLCSENQKKTNATVHNSTRTNTLKKNNSSNNNNNTNDIFGLSPSEVPNLIDDEEENEIFEGVKNYSDLTRSTSISPPPPSSTMMDLDNIITEISKLKKKKLKKEMKNKLEQQTNHNNNSIHHNNENEINTFTQNIKTNSNELKNQDSSNSLISTNSNTTDELLLNSTNSEDDLDISLGQLQLYENSDEDTSDYEYVNEDYSMNHIFSNDTEESFTILEDVENISLSSINKYHYGPIGPYKKKHTNVFENFKMTRNYDEFLKLYNLKDSSDYQEDYELLPGEPFKLNSYYYRDVNYENVKKYIFKEIYDNIQNISTENKIIVSQKEELFFYFIKNLLKNNFICLSYEEEENLLSESKLLLEAMISKKIQ
ncbi:sporozoite invasion-associated protein 2 [Plasmodium reichenowi]|uniref:Sporozoite invasion-associated protein 2 n=1 Tax=Plasmodium reichenowi TaxID=5854 RepID=A0A2P9DCH1_PLARE|nr:sporozoite invasion-associated protein 2 [Plasmodium reichenowi]